MIVPTVCRGFRALYGSWKMIWALRRKGTSCFADSFETSSPSISTLPAVGVSSRRIVRPAVDLPQPLSPTSPRVSPAFRSKLIPSTALTWPTTRGKMPKLADRTGKYFFRSVTLRICFAGPVAAGPVAAISVTGRSPPRPLPLPLPKRFRQGWHRRRTR